MPFYLKQVARLFLISFDRSKLLNIWASFYRIMFNNTFLNYNDIQNKRKERQTFGQVFVRWFKF